MLNRAAGGLNERTAGLRESAGSAEVEATTGFEPVNGEPNLGLPLAYVARRPLLCNRTGLVKPQLLDCLIHHPCPLDDGAPTSMSRV